MTVKCPGCGKNLFEHELVLYGYVPVWGCMACYTEFALANWDINVNAEKLHLLFKLNPEKYVDEFSRDSFEYLILVLQKFPLPSLALRRGNGWADDTRENGPAVDSPALAAEQAIPTP